MSFRILRIAASRAVLLFVLGGVAVSAHATEPANAAKSSGASHGELIPVQDFARHARVKSPRLSPDGTYLSVRVDDADGATHGLAVYRLSDMKVVSYLHMPIYELPLDATWVSPTRLVMEKGKSYGSLEMPVGTGEIIASDFDGKHQMYLYGANQVGRRAATRQDDHGFGTICGLPQKANGHFYLCVQSWSNDKLSSVYDIDADHNTRGLLVDLPVAGMSFLMNPKGKPTFAYGTNVNMDFVVYRNLDGRWVQLDASKTGENFLPFAYAPDQHTIYAYWSKHGEPNVVIREDQTGSGRQVVAKDAFSDIDNVQWTAYPSQPFAVTASAGIPKPTIINPTLPAAKLYQAMEKSFPGKFVDFINFSEDGHRLLFSVASDRDPGTYYLYDTQTHKASKLFDAEPWIDPTRMAERRPVRFKASDGVELEGILTLPPHRGEGNLPMVLVPHGGPHGPSDNWFYDSDAQFLASRGYLVLQVNYRGSGGRGDSFEQSGYRKWGTRIQQDLIDGVHWAIDKKYADPQRVCVYGGSFGGYSALMATIRAPGMFKCAIGYAGIYDLAMMYDKGDIQRRESGRNYLLMAIGKNQAELDANSPAKLADKIDVPVFLAHGEDDKRAPFAQAKAMRKALEAAHKPYEWMAFDGEGHGFYTEEHRVALLTKMQAFLEKYIGKGAPIKH